MTTTAQTHATPATTEGLVLDFVALGLDPTDLDVDVDDNRAELYYHDGPILTVNGYERYDVDKILDVAAWWDTLATKAAQVATQLRVQANSVCDGCHGYGTRGSDDADCTRCAGSGVLA